VSNRLRIPLILICLLAHSVITLQTVERSARAQNCQDFPDRTFPSTVYHVCDPFLKYWNQHGGVTQQGYPISAEINEISQNDGRVYKMQYFERAVLEYHPEFAGTSSEVSLSLLGTFRYRQKYPNGAPGQHVISGSINYPQTGHSLGGVFKDYWDSHGGLAQQGFPISDEFLEQSDLDHKWYTVQYFERAVFEWHEDKLYPDSVLLSQLGVFRWRDNYASNTFSSQSLWGGTVIGMIRGQDTSTTGMRILAYYADRWDSNRCMRYAQGIKIDPGQSTFVMTGLDPDRYFFIAYPTNNLPATGGFSYGVLNSPVPNTSPHQLIPITVLTGQTIGGIQIGDWPSDLRIFGGYQPDICG